MKKLLFLLIVGMSVPTFSYSQSAQIVVTDDLAKVFSEDGYLLFMFSAPVQKYSTLGYLKKAKVVWSGKPEEMFKKMIKKVKKQYPNADALIIETGDMNEVRAIKFEG